MRTQLLVRICLISFQVCAVSSCVVVSGVVGIVAVAAASYTWLYCRCFECCYDHWLSTNVTQLSLTLRSKIYGQHLVTETVVKQLHGHFRYQPRKALVLSFHGGHGTGKTYVSKIVAEQLFALGMQSKYVHFISTITDLSDGIVPTNKMNLRERIKQAVRMCPRSLFIIDDIDQMSDVVMDTIKPFLDYHDNVDGVDYRQAVFIFLSNNAAEQIASKTLENLQNKKRESITIEQLEEVMTLPERREDSSDVWRRQLVSNALISAHVPFLPLEKSHVQQCIREVLHEARYSTSERETEALVTKVADKMTYFPEPIKKFSKTGCKGVREKIYQDLEVDFIEQ